MIRHFRVAAGILVDGGGNVLIAERLGDGPFHGMWEFPGGKIGQNESAVDALERELVEELGVRVTAFEHFMNLHHEYPDRRVTIDFYLVTEWRDEPTGLEGQQLEWISIGELDGAKLLPADAPVVRALQDQQILS
ncbi:MAG: 8-oxo-dGTP diphosphatase MutT [Woeseiaceae bacterium]|nr:8-oxo-dGTP diphosphatase MutT [Woeseiaceae bacterium]